MRGASHFMCWYLPVIAMVVFVPELTANPTPIKLNDPIEIKCGDFVVGTLTFDTYDKVLSSDARYGGARLRGFFHFTGCPDGETFDGKFRWIQLVNTNYEKDSSPAGSYTYLDGLEDGKPFYWSDNPSHGDYRWTKWWDETKQELEFRDTPTRFLNRNPDVWWHATLVLVCECDDQVNYLQGIQWGFTSGREDGKRVITLDELALISETSDAMDAVKKLVAAAGWKETDDCCCIPAPSALLLVGIGAGCAGWMRRRRVI